MTQTEGRSYQVRAFDAGVARVAARRQAQDERHPGAQTARVLWIEELAPRLFEVVLETKGAAR